MVEKVTKEFYRSLSGKEFEDKKDAHNDEFHYRISKLLEDCGNIFWRDTSADEIAGVIIRKWEDLEKIRLNYILVIKDGK